MKLVNEFTKTVLRSDFGAPTAGGTFCVVRDRADAQTLAGFGSAAVSALGRPAAGIAFRTWNPLIT